MAAPKQPQDHKKKAEKVTEPHDPNDLFEFTSRDGEQTIRLPYLENLTRGQVKKLTVAEKAGEDAEDVLFSMLLDEAAQSEMDDLSLWDYNQLIDNWNSESAVTLGESTAS